MNAFEFIFERAESGRTAVLCDEARITYGELIESATGAGSLLKTAGLEPGDHVAIFSDNSVFWIEAYLGVLYASGVVAPLPPRIMAIQIPSLLKWLECEFIFVEKKYADQLSSLEAGGFAFVEDPLRLGYVSRIGAIRKSPARDLPLLGSKDHMASLMLTSGSTSEPRAVQVSHRNIVSNTKSIVEALHLTADHRMLCVMPFSYCFSTSLLHTHLRVGGSLAIYSGTFAPGRALNVLSSLECSSLAGIPSVFQVLSRTGSFGAHPTPSLRYIQQAGGRLAPMYVQALQEAIPQAKIYLMYGQTEATARLTVLPANRLSDKIDSVGVAVPGVELSVLKEDGTQAIERETGEIVARGDNVTVGYWRDEVATRARFRGNALHTGDMGFRDEEGYFYIVDREEDFIKAAGHRFSAQRVENCIQALPGVLEVAVVGVPHRTLGEASKAYIVLKPGTQLTQSTVMRCCRKDLPHYMAPRQIVIVAELPKNSAGKVLKSALRRLE